MTRIFTLASARDEKRNAELPSLARAEALRAEQVRVAQVLRDNPQIGVLQGAKGLRYYVNWPTYREHTDPAALV
jgi:hypothetical protein